MRSLSKIYVEITTVCNLQCAFCPPTLRPAGFLPRERFRALVRRIEGQAKALYFHIKGEPLLHPELPGLIEDAGAAGFEVRLTTNGTLLPKRIGELCGHPALKRVNISLHSMDTLPPGERAELEAAILESARRLAEEPSIGIVSLRSWNATEPGRSLVKLSPKINIHRDERFIWPALRPPRERPQRESPPGRSGPDSFDMMEKDSPAVEAWSPADFGPRGFCRALRDQAGILLDGTVVPCCLDAEGDIALGSVYDQIWPDIIASRRARALYQGFSERRVVEPLCRTCGFRTRFGS